MKLLLKSVLLAITIITKLFVTNTEANNVDESFKVKQRKLLDLYVGVWQINQTGYKYDRLNEQDFTNPAIVREFEAALTASNFLPYDATFSMRSTDTREYTKKLFELFFTARTFDIFYKTASNVRKLINQMQFTIAYTLAILHRVDCQQFIIPPMYEIFPTYFVPMDTMHQVYNARMLGIKRKTFTYKNSGNQQSYASSVISDPVQNSENKLSYFLEDVGLSHAYATYLLKSPYWLCPERYKQTFWYRRGETFYHFHQQLLARYLMERIANGLHSVELLHWQQPIRIGYNPRVSHFNGRPLYKRPDNIIPIQFNRDAINKLLIIEGRINEVIDYGSLWNSANVTLLSVDTEDGVETLGRLIYGTTERLNRKFYPSYYWQAIDSLSFLTNIADDTEYIGEALSTPFTMARDPLFYQFLSRLISMFEQNKKRLGPHTDVQLSYKGVSIEEFTIDKLTTYFDIFGYEISNSLPIIEKDQYTNYNNTIYRAQHVVLNHRPFTYSLSIMSEQKSEAAIRIFLGPKYDANGRLFTLEQSRLAYYEIDRFKVNLTRGVSKINVNSTDSLMFKSGELGFGSLYRYTSTFSGKLPIPESTFTNQRKTCVRLPERLKLPRGKKTGQSFIIAIIVTPAEPKYFNGERKLYTICGEQTELMDTKPYGFPFDRKIKNMKRPNILFKDVLIYHEE